MVACDLNQWPCAWYKGMMMLAVAIIFLGWVWSLAEFKKTFRP